MKLASMGALSCLVLASALFSVANAAVVGDEFTPEKVECDVYPYQTGQEMHGATKLLEGVMLSYSGSAANVACLLDLRGELEVRVNDPQNEEGLEWDRPTLTAKHDYTTYCDMSSVLDRHLKSVDAHKMYDVTLFEKAGSYLAQYEILRKIPTTGVGMSKPAKEGGTREFALVCIPSDEVPKPQTPNALERASSPTERTQSLVEQLSGDNDAHNNACSYYLNAETRAACLSEQQKVIDGGDTSAYVDFFEEHQETREVRDDQTPEEKGPCNTGNYFADLRCRVPQPLDEMREFRESRTLPPYKAPGEPESRNIAPEIDPIEKATAVSPAHRDTLTNGDRLSDNVQQFVQDGNNVVYRDDPVREGDVARERQQALIERDATAQRADNLLKEEGWWCRNTHVWCSPEYNQAYQAKERAQQRFDAADADFGAVVAGANAQTDAERVESSSVRLPTETLRQPTGPTADLLKTPLQREIARGRAEDRVLVEQSKLESMKDPGIVSQAFQSIGLQDVPTQQDIDAQAARVRAAETQLETLDTRITRREEAERIAAAELADPGPFGAITDADIADINRRFPDTPPPSSNQPKVMSGDEIFTLRNSALAAQQDLDRMIASRTSTWSWIMNGGTATDAEIQAQIEKAERLSAQYQEEAGRFATVHPDSGHVNHADSIANNVNITAENFVPAVIKTETVRPPAAPAPVPDPAEAPPPAANDKQTTVADPPPQTPPNNADTQTTPPPNNRNNQNFEQQRRQALEQARRDAAARQTAAQRTNAQSTQQRQAQQRPQARPPVIQKSEGAWYQPSCEITADKARVHSGGTVRLKWETSRAQTVTLNDKKVEKNNTKEGLVVRPKDSITTYVIKATSVIKTTNSCGIDIAVGNVSEESTIPVSETEYYPFSPTEGANTPEVGVIRHLPQEI